MADADKTLFKNTESTLFRSEEEQKPEGQINEGTLFTVALDDEKDSAFQETETTEWQTTDILDDLYRVEKVLGEGGMGKVYKVYHLNWSINLAVKIIKPSKLSFAMLQVFKKEAETWINLAKHPHIATAFYVKEVMDVPAIFVEYVDGGTLNDWLKAGKLASIEEKLRVAIQFCEGMVYAHSKGLVHRDIKPDNVLMELDGTVKITDFGLAKSITIENEQEPGMAGTPPYMPPEQWTNAALVKAPADIYAFGVMLYEILCGVRPFELDDKDTRPQVIAYRLMHLMEKPKNPFIFNRNISPELNKLILKCLEKKPECRFQNINEVVDILNDIYKYTTGTHYKSVEFDPEKSKADDLNNRALSFLDLGQEDKAKDIWQEALKIEENHYATNINLALFNRQKNICTQQECLNMMNKGVGDRFYDPEVYYYKALLNLEMRDFNEGLENINRSLGKTIQTAKCLNIKGLCLLGISDYEEAIVCFEEALKLDSDNYGYLGNLATALHQNGDKELITDCNNRIYKLPLKKYIEKTQKNPELLWKVNYRNNFIEFTPRVYMIALSLDGTKAISCSTEKKIMLWDLKTGRCINNLKIRASLLYSMALNADGTKAVFGSSEKTIEFWDLSSGKCLTTLHGNISGISSLAIDSNATKAISSGTGKTIELWDLESRKCHAVLEGHHASITSLAMSADGKRAISSSADKTLKIWDLYDGCCLNTLEVHKDIVNSVVMSADGNKAISGSSDKTMILWDLNSGKCLKTFTEHTKAISTVAMNIDGTKAISGSYDETVKFWDLSTGKCLKTFKIRTSTKNVVAMSANGKIAISCSNGDTMKIWELEYLKDLAYSIYYDEESYLLSKVTSVQEDIELKIKFEDLVKQAQKYYAKNNYKKCYNIVLDALKVSGFKEDVSVKNLLKNLYSKAKLKKIKKAVFLKSLDEHTDTVWSVAINADGTKAISAGGNGDKRIKLWDLNNGICLKTFVEPMAVYSVAMSSDGTMAISGGSDKIIKLWDLSTGTCIRTLTGHTSDVNTLAICANNLLAVSGGSDELIKIWDLGTGVCLKTLTGHTNKVDSLAISADGTKAISNSWDGMVKIWDLSNSKCLKNLIENGSVDSVAINMDGTKAVTGGGYGDNYRLKLWDLNTAENLKVMEGHKGPVRSVAISFDGTKAITGGSFEDETVKIWDLTTGICLKTLTGHNCSVPSVAISTGGTKVISSGGSKDRTVKVWELEWELEFSVDNNNIVQK